MRLVRTHSHHSEHCLHQFGRRGQSEFWSLKFEYKKEAHDIYHIGPVYLCELDDNSPVCPCLFDAQYSFGSQHCQSLGVSTSFVLPTQVYELTETVVKCCRSYMRCARCLGRDTIER